MTAYPSKRDPEAIGRRYIKALLLLGILQSACLLFLAFKLAAIDSPPAVAAVAQPNPTLVQPDVRAPSPPIQMSWTPDEARLRQIIRDELQQQLPRGGTSSVAPVPLPRPPHRDESADRQRKEYVEQKIAYYKRVQAIDDAEMLELQAEIARLNPPDGKEMLSKLIQAMNAREIRGRLQ